ncbi:MAG TPA: DUF6328 family protein [Stellaceae bacterium]|nr:DUF6328 family protein [Stellaceae bacterium]
MKLSAKTKLGLDELRMLILGANILLGFQLRGAFTERFPELTDAGRYLSAVSLGCLVCVVALLIAPNPYHRIVEDGDDSGCFHRLVTVFADAALLPFAIALSLDVFPVIELAWGTAAGIAAGTAAGGAALAAWYGGPLVARHVTGQAQRRTTAMTSTGRRQKTPIHTKIEQSLTEARVIIPGAQALLGFQLSIILTHPFAELPAIAQAVHAACLGLIALSVILLMAPAAYHRIVYEGEDCPEMYRIASTLITLATVPLALGLAGDVYVVVAKIAGAGVGIAAGLGTVMLLLGLWYAYPFATACLMRRAALPKPGQAKTAA